jgi:hypothetical protein
MRCPYLKEVPMPFPDEIAEGYSSRRELPTVGICTFQDWGFRMLGSDLEKCKQLSDSQECWRIGRGTSLSS